MSIVLLITFMVVFVSLLFVIVSSPVDTSTVNVFLDEAKISHLSITTDYVGGLSNVLEKTKCTLILMKDKINVRIAFKNVDLLIPFDKITNIEMMTASALNDNFENGIYITRRDIKNDARNFLVINYLDNVKNSEKALIFECKDCEAFINSLKAWNQENAYMNEDFLNCVDAKAFI